MFMHLRYRNDNRFIQHFPSALLLSLILHPLASMYVYSTSDITALITSKNLG